MAVPPSVCVTIVTYNSAEYITRCLTAVLEQRGVSLEVVVVDNASTDESCELVGRFGDRVRLYRNLRNSGFAAGQNRAIAASDSEWVLALNPDVRLEPGFIARLVESAAADPQTGMACGKLLAIGKGFEPFPTRLLDSTGIVVTPALRHLDRGWHEPDRGQYDEPEYVFGATGAAALYRRRMIEDVSGPDGFFDPDFFCYREDADLAWRAQLLGWRCLYVPSAEAYHVRRVTPEVRRSLPAALNMHSVKNRFLMRVKNITQGVYRRHAATILARDMVVVAACLLWEFRSLPAFWKFAMLLPSAWRKRQAIMERRRASEEYMTAWFAAPETVGDKTVGNAEIVMRRAS